MSSQQTHRLPILLIPVYQGGRLFGEAVDSVMPCLSWFSRVIISLNGLNVDDDRATALRLMDLCNLEILETQMNLSAPSHADFIYSQLSDKLQLPLDTQIFILCHDDLLSKDGFKALKMDFWQSFRSDWVSLGDYYAFSGTSPVSRFRHESWFARYDQSIIRPQSAFLSTQYQRHDDPFTNVSGMCASLAVLRSTTRFFALTGSRSGMRFEYSLIVNKRVNHVVNFRPPLVCVRERADSEGAMVTRRDFVASELRYAIWIWINCKSVAGVGSLLRGQYGIRGLLWLIRVCLLHRYYDFLGLARSILVRIGFISAKEFR